MPRFERAVLDPGDSHKTTFGSSSNRAATEAAELDRAKMIAVPALRPAEEGSVLGLRTSLFKAILLAESVRQRVSANMFG
jgi:hypothetical protein